jgi:hypothetical protein
MYSSVISASTAGRSSAYELLTGGRYAIRVGERPHSAPGVFLRILLRAHRRKLIARANHPSLLLRLRLLCRSLQPCGRSAQRACEGVMTTIEHTKRASAHSLVRQAYQRCAHCDGPFGMVTHRWWGCKFCKRRCKDAYIRETMLCGKTVGRWSGLLSVISRSRSFARQKQSCVAPA